jgi:hypothetical protein
MATLSGQAVCKTLERNYGGVLKIPAGTYTCQRRMSPHFGYEVFELQGVPGHNFIEIHIANWQTQLDGCIALGLTASPPMLQASHEAFEKFMALQNGVNEFQLKIE